MNFHVLTLFPDMIVNGLNHSIIGRAIDNKILQINTINIRDYADNKHMKVDIHMVEVQVLLCRQDLFVLPMMI